MAKLANQTVSKSFAIFMLLVILYNLPFSEIPVNILLPGNGFSDIFKRVDICPQFICNIIDKFKLNIIQ